MHIALTVSEMTSTPRHLREARSLAPLFFALIWMDSIAPLRPRASLGQVTFGVIAFPFAVQVVTVLSTASAT
jgi:hypothetical protein